ncbi:hypothetical protein BT67DRAFT_240176 [Trichocladium antarcticum]|uniref:Uncharacterized protein n=1 Tax=Trichocladium antarcticum TaxID=1450529 RepID=A0AAN6ZAE1_9PEZI|nr:hypothetical protein BT67DRAFT_240176 [Trichocladium antarcticum]
MRLYVGRRGHRTATTTTSFPPPSHTPPAVERHGAGPAQIGALLASATSTHHHATQHAGGRQREWISPWAMVRPIMRSAPRREWSFPDGWVDTCPDTHHETPPDRPSPRGIYLHMYIQYNTIQHNTTRHPTGARCQMDSGDAPQGMGGGTTCPRTGGWGRLAVGGGRWAVGGGRRYLMLRLVLYTPGTQPQNPRRGTYCVVRDRKGGGKAGVHIRAAHHLCA